MREIAKIKSTKKVIFISEDEELFKSFKRAIKAVYDINISNFKKRLNSEDIAVIFDNIVENNRDFERWFCGFFRKIFRNPLIIIGAEEEKSFIQRYPVFRVYSYNHAYILIPFKLQQLIDILFKIKPVYDKDTRKFIIEDFCKRYEYALVTHELKIMTGNKEATIINFARAREFYENKDDKYIVRYLNKILKEIRKRNDWLSIAREAKQTLVENVKNRGDRE